MAFGNHAAHVIMNAAGKDRTKHDPQEYDRTKAGAHERAENRAGSGDVEKLHKKCLPCFHRHKVDAVLQTVRRCFPVVRSKHPVHDPTICQIAND